MVILPDMSAKPTLTIYTEGFPEESYIAVLSGNDDVYFSLWHVDDEWFDEKKRNYSNVSENTYRLFYEKVKSDYEQDGLYLWGYIAKGNEIIKYSYGRPSQFRILV